MEDKCVGMDRGSQEQGTVGRREKSLHSTVIIKKKNPAIKGENSKSDI